MQTIWKTKQKLDKKVKDRKKAIIDLLLANRGIKTEKQKQEFFHPKDPSELSLKDIGVSKTEFTKALKRLKKAKDDKQKVVIYGDYDADGITATAIMWETLHSLGIDVMPFLPHREEQGYGLKENGIDAVVEKFGKPDLIVTVDNGIVAFDGADHCKKLGIDLIICDHHEALEKSNKYPENKKGEEKIPNCIACIHSTQTAGAGVAFLFAKELLESFEEKDSRLRGNDTNKINSLLELATIGIIADVVPLLGVSRAIVKKGLQLLPKTKRPGLKALFSESKIDTSKNFSTYHIGFVIAPRLNASGRLHHSIDSLRLLCTKKNERGIKLAIDLGSTNKDRQDLTNVNVEKVLKHFGDKKLEEKIIITESKNYNPGVIGLIAGKLTERFYRPSITVAIIDGYAKGSVRSIAGVDIISILRKFEDDFVDLGGHKMAAGFTVLTDKFEDLKKKLEKYCKENIDEKLLVPTLEMEAELESQDLNLEVYEEIEKMGPFGMGNVHPVFLLKNVEVKSANPVGKDRKHLKLSFDKDGLFFDGIYFSAGEWITKIKNGDQVHLAFQLNLNEWNGIRKIQFLVKEIGKVPEK